MAVHKLNIGYRGLPVFFMKEGKVFIAYTPSLDLATHGKTIVEAQKNFVEALNLFFEELVAHGTLDQVLKDMGWHKKESQWQPPIEVSKIANVPFKVPAFA